MSATVGEIMEDALEAIGEAAGPGVQEYAEDRMMKEVIRSFNVCFKKYHWHQYRQWFRLQLDGTTGLVSTNDLEDVKDFEDFFAVHLDGQRNPLPMLPRAVNPYALATSGGPMYWTSLNVSHAYFATKKLQFYPITATNYVNIGARVYPVLVSDQWTQDDVMYLDKDMLVYGAAFMTLVGDDLNGGAADMMKNLMEMRYRDIMNGLAAQETISGGSGNDIPMVWSA